MCPYSCFLFGSVLFKLQFSNNMHFPLLSLFYLYFGMVARARQGHLILFLYVWQFTGLAGRYDKGLGKKTKQGCNSNSFKLKTLHCSFLYCCFLATSLITFTAKNGHTSPPYVTCPDGHVAMNKPNSTNRAIQPSLNYCICMTYVDELNTAGYRASRLMWTVTE